MPQHLAIEVDGHRVTTDQPMTEAQARQWLTDQAVRLTRREAIVSERLDRSAPRLDEG